MPVQTNLAFVGIAKQTGKGTAATTPLYGIPVTGGMIAGAGIEQSHIPIISGNPGWAEAERTASRPIANCPTLAYVRSAGLLLLGALGSVTTTGTTPNFTHTFSVAADLPYHTVWGRYASDYTRLVDAKVQELAFELTGPGAGRMTAALNGITWNANQASWTATNDEVGASFFKGAGGVFSVDTASGTPVSAKIQSGTVTITRNIDPVILAAAITPDDVVPGQIEVAWSLTLRPDNLDEWKKIVTGTAGGTTVAGSPSFGSAKLKFTIDANTDLEVQSTRVMFSAELPDANPDGGAAELVLEGTALKPSAAGVITAVLKNATASY